MDLEKHILLNTLCLNYCTIGIILMDLSKAYDCFPDDLVIAKFEAYGLRRDSLKLLLDYVEGRKQRVKIESSYSFCSDVKRDVPDGSIIGPLLFNAFLSMICLCLLITVKSVILSKTTTPFIVVKWNYLAF